ncbi:MAG: 23S rRNA (uracil(1939)-C(5))-methyltransferase RlmD [Clostridium sp.]|nr:23S rRNA (uracil(1939)-C(5))-methyltransferase RlmD [Clostridium sp.]MCM1171823.1 23S rRNA (uracil(1939)-C(5))-methyltransferase RlmD [Clostridium sp.]MCM1207767.1 23S rRNA (uracil(1939)-C(5))-methyltransferase RlmD [Ruminococcus sp.]
MKKGEIYEGVITKYDFPNKASLMYEDRKVIIKGALLGQKVRFMLTKKKSGTGEGKLLEVLEKSPLEDAVPSCPHFELCGGCSYQTMSYENQLKLKEQIVRQLIGKYIGEGDVDDGQTKALNTFSSLIENCVFTEPVGSGTVGSEQICSDEGKKHNGNIVAQHIWEGIVASPLRYEYRNKMEFTFGDEYKDGPLALGLHKRGGFYDILNVCGCRIVGKEWSAILDYALNYFKDKGVPYYHKMRHEGILRNLVVRQSFATKEFLVNLVTSTQWDKYGFNKESILREFVDGLVLLADSIGFDGSMAGILYTENDSLGDVVACDNMQVPFGKDYITEEILGLKFKISPFSFFQTNTKGCEVLYAKAREYIMSGTVMGNGLNENAVISGAKGKVIFDLYSGTGTIAQMLAPVAKKVIGIELVEEAVEAAKENAKLNNLNNCEFIAGDVLKAIDLVEDKPDVIILDPPRDGINPKALEKILAFNVEEMVYISCKPTSLARDLEIITNRGYEVKRACAVDEFPGTGHVESIVLLSKLHTK